MSGADDSGTRVWPAGQSFEPGELVHVTCSPCEQHWAVHRDLEGYRLRCTCGSWVRVPRAAADLPLLADTAPAPDLPAKSRSVTTLAASTDGLVRLPKRPDGEVFRGRISVDTPLADDELRHASVEIRAQWTNRAVLELVGVLAAFWVPALVAFFTYSGSELAGVMPFVSLSSSILVLAVGLSAGTYAFGGLRWPRMRYLAEAALATAAFLLLASLLMEMLPNAEAWESEIQELRETLGRPLLLFVIGFCPGVFEELAFRGLLQGRLTALLGRNQAILATGAAFALAHGVTMAFPIHLSIGVYLCWLRARSGSLLPGMLLHAAYNSVLVW